jgi:hypothetical protein
MKMNVLRTKCGEILKLGGDKKIFLGGEGGHKREKLK